MSKRVNNKIFTFNKESKKKMVIFMGLIKPKEITNLIKEKLNAGSKSSQIILKINK